MDWERVMADHDLAELDSVWVEGVLKNDES